MKKSTKVYTLFIALTLAVGGITALLTSGSMKDYEAIAKPSFAPPGWIFPIVWTILYVLMAWAAARVWLSDSVNAGIAIIFYAIQLVVNFFWPIIFFNFGAFLFAFIWLILLLVLVIVTAVEFNKADKTAANLLIPYIVWLVFAAVLNLSVYLMNR